MTDRRPARRLPLLARAICLALCAAAPLATMGLAHAQPAAAVRTYDVPAGPLDAALRSTAAQAGVALTFTPAQTAGHRSDGLRGSHTVESAFAALLAGTALQAVRLANGGWALREAHRPTPAGQADAATSGATLATVTVAEQIERSSVTEDTGAYTANWMKTANGLPLPQRQTPQSVSIITRQMMDDHGMANVKDVVQNATGLTVNQYETDRFEFYARGFQIDNYQYDGVPVTLDSTYQYGDGSLDTVVYDRIEIVRGATGLMQNTGEPGASINFIRKRPTREFQGYASMLTGTRSNRRSELDVGGPLNEQRTLRGRIVGALQTKGDTLHLYEQDKSVLYGVLEADLSPRATVTVGASRQQTHSDRVTWAGMPAFDANGSLIDWPKGSTTGANWTNWDTTFNETFAAIDYTLTNDWKARLAYSHLQNDFSSKLLYVYGNADLETGLGTSAQATRYRGDREQNALSGSLNGDFALFGRRHQFVTGFFVSRTTGGIVERTADPSSMADVGNIFAWNGSYPEPRWNTEPSNVTDTRSRQFGLYGATRLSIIEPLAVTLGARLNDWRGKLDSFWANYDYRHAGVVTPYAGITYDLDRTYTLYASYTNIFKPQTYQDAQGNYLKPAKGHNVEAGIKAALFGGRVNASIAVFQTDQDNVAEYVEYDSTQNRSIYRSIAGTRTRGFEMEAAGRVSPGLNVFAGFTHRTSKDNEGNAVNTFQPRNTAKAGAAYQLPGAWNRLTVGGAMRWQSETSNIGYWLDASQRITQPSYAIIDVMARYRLTDKTSLDLNVYNLADKRYFRTMGFYNSVFYGEGRTATLALKHVF